MAMAVDSAREGVSADAPRIIQINPEKIGL